MSDGTFATTIPTGNPRPSVLGRRLVVACLLAAVTLEMALLLVMTYQARQLPQMTLIVGGATDDPFSSQVRQGAAVAAANLGIQIDTPAMSWTDSDQLNQFRRSIAQFQQGIAISGHPGDVGVGSLVDQAFDHGIRITSLNVDLPETFNRHRDQGFGYVGLNQLRAGEIMGKACLERLHLPAGSKVAMISGYSGDTSRRQMRPDAAIAALRAGGMEVVLERVPRALSDAIWSGDPVQLKLFVDKLFADFPDLRLIICDGVQVVPAMVTALAQRRATQRIDLTCYDLTPTVATLINQGQVAFTIDQQAFLQGYFSVLQLCLSDRIGVHGLEIDTGATLIDRAELTTLNGYIRKGLR